MSEQNWNPEPWHTWGEHEHAGQMRDSHSFYPMRQRDYERARVCVNACAGMKDPEREIGDLRFFLANHVGGFIVEGEQE